MALKLPYAINAKSQRIDWQRLAIAYAIGKEKARAMAGLCCFGYVTLKDC
jgi:hypothetical protein